MYRQYKNDKDFQALKDNINNDFLALKKDTNDNIIKNIHDSNNKFGEQKKRINEIKKNTEDYLYSLRKTFRETKISSLLMCLSSFPDPQMTADSEDKKKQIFKLMKNILTTYVEYIENVELQEKAGKVDLEAVFMVLTNLKLAIVRSHGAYSEIHQNIRFSQIIQYITEVNNDIIIGNPIGNLTSRLKNIASLIRGLVDIIEK